MALSKKITLDNGVVTNYHTIYVVETNAEKNTTLVLVHGFLSKEIFNKSNKRSALKKEQIDYVKEFDELVNIENPTKTQQNKLAKLQEKINTLADKIAEFGEYDSYVLKEFIIDLPYTEDLSIKNIQEMLIETNQFKQATIVN